MPAIEKAISHIHDVDRAHIKGLRSVAAVEIAKGLLALVVTTALVVLLRRGGDLQDVALSIIDFLHIDPDRRIPTMFLEAAGRAMDMNIVFVLSFAAVYIALRFIEGYGLWRARVWAEWMALISGSIYLPLEIHAIVRKGTLTHWMFLITNLIILAYIAYVRFGERKPRPLITASAPGLESDR